VARIIKLPGFTIKKGRVVRDVKRYSVSKQLQIRSWKKQRVVRPGALH